MLSYSFLRCLIGMEEVSFTRFEPNPELIYSIIPLRLSSPLAIILHREFCFFLFFSFGPKLLGNISDFCLSPLPNWLVSSGREMNGSFCVGSFVIQGRTESFAKGDMWLFYTYYR